jgi:sec-independent protein translocase protein TatA
MRPRAAATMRSIMPTPGPLEIIIVLIIVLVIFGPKRLPDLGRSLGRGMREFKDSVTGKDKEHEQLDSVKTVGDAPDSPATTTTSSTREQQS